MEAHYVLNKHGFDVCSFGTGAKVKLPGPSIDRPNIYDFGTPYTDMYEELKRQDSDLYVQNGVYYMLERNMKIKKAPERFQDSKKILDFLITCEERCYNAVVEELTKRGGTEGIPVHVFNFDIPDTNEDAAIGARAIKDFAELIEQNYKDLDIDELAKNFQSKTNLRILYTLSFY
ncbi:RNA polymerase II subunit A domain-containing protein [Rozella allomycis CSF55]|uniref:RNA polymerase II subunit A C-terminal domain phosphatase SSU72 n=1 Tax=Rozella allomycis (strain CSF55) TaxID=988480 RepID=A0A075AW45_ROZAC|nr:RNA polymerase II subunit A domain-containing protein [Rozella allomycis CSF55]|eukprot:EPZ34528.1 RNA polymerase II subunit A domain-containing protein [Rozella allomycis CSF55]